MVETDRKTDESSAQQLEVFNTVSTAHKVERLAVSKQRSARTSSSVTIARSLRELAAVDAFHLRRRCFRLSASP